MESPPGREAWQAARLAVLAFRGSIHPSMPLRPDAYRVVSARGAILTAAEVATLLAAAPKPLWGRASASASVVSVRWDTPREGTLEALAYRAARATGGADGPDPFLGELADSAGAPAEQLQVLCAARDEMLLFPLPVVQRWRREYPIVRGGYAADSPENPLAREWPAYSEARARGAVCVLRLGQLPAAAT
jgi:hypothetical protein